MKRNHKKILFLLLTIISLNVYCQDSDVECWHLYYTNPKARVLYHYCQKNDFVILSDFDSIYVTCKGADLIEIDDLSHRYDEDYIGFSYRSFGEKYLNRGYLGDFYSMSNIKSDTVSIFVYNKKDSTLLRQFDYKRIKGPQAKVQLGYLKNSLVTVNDVLMQNELIYINENSYLRPTHCRLWQELYRLKIISNNEIFYLNKFDIYAKNLIRDLKPGDKIIFYGIEILCPGSLPKMLPELEYTIIK